MSNISLPVSVVIPIYNNDKTVDDCLKSIFSNEVLPKEVILVNDGSDNDYSEMYRKYDIRMISFEKNQGVSRARNVGVRCANSEYIFSTDADVIFQKDTLINAYQSIKKNEYDAVIGSYTKNIVGNFWTDFKNLCNYYHHSKVNSETNFFFGACGIIKRKTFWNVGGFDTDKFSKILEDVEFGYRMEKMNMKIKIDPEIKVEHKKEYSYTTLIKSDLFGRAIPWTKLIFYNRCIKFGSIINQKNLIALLCLPIFTTLIFSFPKNIVSYSIPAIVWFLSCSQFLIFLHKEKGTLFMLKSIYALLQFYFISIFGVAFGLTGVIIESILQLTYKTNKNAKSQLKPKTAIGNFINNEI